MEVDIRNLIVNDYKTFSSELLTINETSIARNWHREENQKPKFHFSFRRAVINEIYFFSIFWNPKLIPRPTVIYLNTLGGIHIPMLARLFPDIMFHVFDVKFKIGETKNIKLFHEKFSILTAEKYQNRNDVFFVSSYNSINYLKIKNVCFSNRGIDLNQIGSDFVKYDQDLIVNALEEAMKINEEENRKSLRMNEEFIKMINPEHAFINFRLPFSYRNANLKFNYLEGIVFFQIWKSITSNENYLKPIRNASGKYSSSSWNLLEYENYSYYHNYFQRSIFNYRNPFTGTLEPVDDPELSNDFDSVAEGFILGTYFERLNSDPEQIYYRVKKLSRMITDYLGKFIAPINPTIESLRNKNEDNSVVKIENVVNYDYSIPKFIPDSIQEIKFPSKLSILDLKSSIRNRIDPNNSSIVISNVLKNDNQTLSLKPDSIQVQF